MDLVVKFSPYIDEQFGSESRSSLLAKASFDFFLDLVSSVIYSFSVVFEISSNNPSRLSELIVIFSPNRQSFLKIIHLYVSHPL
jgi:hypothetical protein